jgi:hypothetical protein
MHGLLLPMPQGKLLLTLKTKCRTAYTGLHKRNTDQVHGLAMLVTDFAIARPACLR